MGLLSAQRSFELQLQELFGLRLNHKIYDIVHYSSHCMYIYIYISLYVTIHYLLLHLIM